MFNNFTFDNLKKYIFLALGEDEEIDLRNATLETDLRDFGIDSLAILDASSRIEKALGVRLPEGVSSSIRTFGDFLDVVRRSRFRGERSD